MSTPSTTNPWEETITWQPAQPVEPGEPWLVCLDDGTVGQAFMDHLDWYWSEAIQTMWSPITASVARMARLPIGPPLPFSADTEISAGAAPTPTEETLLDSLDAERRESYRLRCCMIEIAELLGINGPATLDHHVIDEVKQITGRLKRLANAASTLWEEHKEYSLELHGQEGCDRHGSDSEGHAMLEQLLIQNSHAQALEPSPAASGSPS